MKNIFVALLLISFTASGQLHLSMGAGYSKTTIGRLDAGYKKGNHLFFVQDLSMFSKRADLPMIIPSINYGYTVNTWQPFIGYGTKGFSWGVNKYFGTVMLSAGRSGDYSFATVGVSKISYPETKRFFTRNDLLVMGLQFTSGFFDGWNQSIAHHHWGQGKMFWDFDSSWKNKYKDFDAGNTSAAFPGSKGIFVAFTDGFHLTRFGDRAFMLASIALSYNDLKSWKTIMKKVVISAAANRAGFCLFYNGIGKI